MTGYATPNPFDKFDNASVIFRSPGLILAFAGRCGLWLTSSFDYLFVNSAYSNLYSYAAKTVCQYQCLCLRILILFTMPQFAFGNLVLPALCPRRHRARDIISTTYIVDQTMITRTTIYPNRVVLLVVTEFAKLRRCLITLCNLNYNTNDPKVIRKD